MSFAFLARGLAVGFAIAALVGAIGVLCIRRTIAEGHLVGLATGLGAATAEATYGAVAALGLTAISTALLGAQTTLRIAGDLFLAYLGVRTFVSPPPSPEAGSVTRGLLPAFGSAYLLTLANPTTILAFAAVFAGVGLAAGPAAAGEAASLVAGVFLGSAAWWLVLSTSVGLVRGRFDQRAMRAVDRVSGSAIVELGLIALAGAFA